MAGKRTVAKFDSVLIDIVFRLLTRENKQHVTVKKICHELNNDLRVKKHGEFNYHAVYMRLKRLGLLEYVTGKKKITSGEDAPFFVLAMAKYDIKPEALRFILTLQAWKCLTHKEPLTIREALWANRLYCLISHLKPAHAYLYVQRYASFEQESRLLGDFVPSAKETIWWYAWYDDAELLREVDQVLGSRFAQYVQELASKDSPQLTPTAELSGLQHSKVIHVRQQDWQLLQLLEKGPEEIPEKDRRRIVELKKYLEDLEGKGYRASP